jgi:hypothetical protein
MTTRSLPRTTRSPRSAADALRPVQRLTAAYLAVSLLGVVAIVLLRDHHSLVNTTVWIRGVVVAAASLVTCALAARAAQGSAGAFRRLRIVSIAMVVAVAVIVSIPGLIPVWMRVEQVVCGLLLLGVVGLTSRPATRATFR